ncbi:hypothetical protein Tsubulata_048126 [Turnera subulata]|uniref:HTH three-helical bundle domain-containing protein n=1 Tax=Turnera subulata TaxID=218843 RepID=A0A9Q0FY37_9ROSI|nr:hypothetical protein Tsubulata_048126 [Turnera subulata]
MASSFPSRLERSVASALLLLSTTTSPPSPPHRKLGFDGSRGKESLSSISSSSSSLITSEAAMSRSSKVQENARLSHKLRIVSVVPRGHEMKPKVVQRKRSSVRWISPAHRKPTASVPLPAPSASASGGEEGPESSCLSTSSSAASRAARSRAGAQISTSRSLKTSHVVVVQKQRRVAAPDSSAVRRKAVAILKLLSKGCCISEVRIRQLLGDSPDTSKALRRLLKAEKLKRSGTGGRRDPYIYMVLLLN